MRVLVMAGGYTDKLVSKANAKYQNTLDVEGLNYLDEVDSYINRGGDFDRVVIFSKCYTRDGQVSDFESIIGSIIEFTNTVGSRVPNYELILVVDDKDVGLAAVKATLGMRDRTTVIYKEARSLSSAALYKLVADARHTLSSNFDILDLEDVKSNSNYVANSFEDEVDNFGPAEVGTVDSHGTGDWDDWSSGNTSDGWETNTASDGWETSTPSDNWGTESSDGWGDTPVRDKSLQDVSVGDIDNPFGKQFGSSDPFGDSSESNNSGWESGDDPFGESSKNNESNNSGWGTGDDPFGESNGVAGSDDPFGESNNSNWGGDDPFGTSNNGSESSESNWGSGDDPFGAVAGSEAEDDPFREPLMTDGIENDPFAEGADNWNGGGSTETPVDDPFGSEPEQFDDPFAREAEQERSNEYTTHGEPEFTGDDPFGSESKQFNDPFASDNYTSSGSSDDPFGSESEQFNDPFASDNYTSSGSLDDPFKSDTFVGESKEKNFREESLSGSIDDFEDEAFEEIPRASNKSESRQFEDPFGSTNANSFSDFDEPENEPIRTSRSRGASNDFADGFGDEFSDGFEEVSRGPRNSSSRSTSMNSSAVDLFEDENELDGTESMVADIEEEEVEAPQQRGKRGKKPPKNNRNVAPAKQNKSLAGNKMGKLKERLEVFKRNGCIITVTGGVGAGKTTVSANIANMLCKMGYSILVVDMDTEGRGQSSITFDNFSTINSSGLETSGVRAALASTVDRTGRFVNIIRPGFHLLGTGIKVDKISPKECLEAKNVNRLLHQWQNNYNFIIIDIPFDLAVEEFADMVTIANYVIMVEKMSSSGAMNLMIDMMNIQEEDVTDLMFEKAKILFNMEDNCTSILGKKVSSTSQVLNAIDIRLSQLLGHQVPYSFEEMQVIGCMKYSRQADACWFTKKYYTDIAEGNQVFSDILCGIFEV